MTLRSVFEEYLKNEQPVSKSVAVMYSLSFAVAVVAGGILTMDYALLFWIAMLLSVGVFVSICVSAFAPGAAARNIANIVQYSIPCIYWWVVTATISFEQGYVDLGLAAVPFTAIYLLCFTIHEVYRFKKMLLCNDLYYYDRIVKALENERRRHQEVKCYIWPILFQICTIAGFCWLFFFNGKLWLPLLCFPAVLWVEVQRIPFCVFKIMWIKSIKNSDKP